MTISATPVRRILIMACLCCLVAAAGCDQRRGAESHPSEQAAPYVTAKELSERVSSSELPVLVEFSVPAGCYRCNEMGQQINMLATNREGRLQVCRVNLNYERSLAAELGISVCPTYVAFDAGKEVFRMSYPTSGDMLAAQLDGLLAAP